jgi:hypothetical protein
MTPGVEMLNANDLAQMQSDMALIRSDNEVSVVLRRGTSTLAAQGVRISSGNSGSRASSGQTQESQAAIVMLGPMGMDIAIDDRFTLTVAGGPVLYRVTWIRPDRRFATMAHAEVVE